MFAPTTDIKKYEETEGQLFNSDDDGWDFLVEQMGEEFVLFDEKNKPFMLFESVRGGTDGLRPRDLDWQWHDRRTYYSDADCFIFVHDLYNRVDWSEVKDIEAMERMISLYQNKMKKHGSKLIILPL